VGSIERERIGAVSGQGDRNEFPGHRILIHGWHYVPLAQKQLATTPRIPPTGSGTVLTGSG
jgi:hypothetical protein